MVSYLMETCTTSDTSLPTWYRTFEFTRRGRCNGVVSRENRMRPRSACNTWILLMPHKKDEPASQVKRTHRRSVVQRGSFSDARGIATTSGLARPILFKELSMRFYNHSHAFYAGVDLHARSMFTHILDHDGKTVFEADLPANPAAFRNAIAPYRAGLVVGCECMFSCRRPLRRRRDPLHARPRPLHASDPRRQGEERSHRRRQDRGPVARRHVSDGLRLSARQARYARPLASALLLRQSTRATAGAHRQHQQPIQPSAFREEIELRGQSLRGNHRALYTGL